MTGGRLQPQDHTRPVPHGHSPSFRRKPESSAPGSKDPWLHRKNGLRRHDAEGLSESRPWPAWRIWEYPVRAHQHSRSPAGAILASVVVLAAAAVPASQGPQSPARADAPLVTVAFRAVTGEGKPFLDVRLEDVALKVNGRDRVLHSLVLVQPGTEPAPGAPADVPPPFVTNARAGATYDTILVGDDESIRPGGEIPAREAAGQFLSHLSPGGCSSTPSRPLWRTWRFTVSRRAPCRPTSSRPTRNAGRQPSGAP